MPRSTSVLLPARQRTTTGKGAALWREIPQFCVTPTFLCAVSWTTSRYRTGASCWTLCRAAMCLTAATPAPPCRCPPLTRCASAGMPTRPTRRRWRCRRASWWTATGRRGSPLANGAAFCTANPPRRWTGAACSSAPMCCNWTARPGSRCSCASTCTPKPSAPPPRSACFAPAFARRTASPPADARSTPGCIFCPTPPPAARPRCARGWI